MVERLKPENFTEENSPFRVRVQFSSWEVVQMVLCFCILLPIRVVVGLVSLVLAWMVSSIGLIGMDLSKPLQGWRKCLKIMSCSLGRVCVRCVGFHNVDIIGTKAHKDIAPVIVAAPHSSFFDALAIFWSGLPFFVSREENKEIPFIGKCIQFAQAIHVKREDRNDRQKTKDEINRRCQSDDPWEQFLIFPEGTTSNRKALMTFKPGGFLPGKTIQPLLIKYKNHHDTVSWTWDQPHGFMSCFLWTCCQWNNRVELHFLDPYTPSEEERNDPRLFAENVRQVMATALGVPLCDMTFEDIKEMYSTKTKNPGEKEEKND